MQHTMANDFYARLRATTIYLIGTIFYKEKDYEHAMEFLCPVALELSRSHCKKQLADC